MAKELFGYEYVINIDKTIIWNLRCARSTLFIYYILGKREKFNLLLILRAEETQN